MARKMKNRSSKDGSNNMRTSKPVDLSKMTEEEILKGFRDGSIRPENKGKYWSEDDQDQLVIMYRNGISLSKIAIKFGRNERAISQQLELLDEVTLEGEARCSHRDEARCKCEHCKIYSCPNNPRYRPPNKLECHNDC